MPDSPGPGVLTGRVALVTGAARNIGAASARAIAAAGARVFVTDIDATGLEATAAAIRAAHGPHAVATRVADLADPAAAADVVTAAVAEHGRLDVLVHAAVDRGRGRIEDLTPEQWHRAFAVNVGAATWLVREALPRLERDGGCVVLFSSVQAHGGIPGCSLYASTKGAIETLTKHLCVELGSRGIRVNAISPGAVTEDWHPRHPELPAYPLDRFGHPDEIASLVVFLASPQASWTSGSILTVDGGMTAMNPGHASARAKGWPRYRRVRSAVARRLRSR